MIETIKTLFIYQSFMPDVKVDIGDTIYKPNSDVTNINAITFEGTLLFPQNYMYMYDVFNLDLLMYTDKNDILIDINIKANRYDKIVYFTFDDDLSMDGIIDIRDYITTKEVFIIEINGESNVSIASYPNVISNGYSQYVFPTVGCFNTCEPCPMRETGGTLNFNFKSALETKVKNLKLLNKEFIMHFTTLPIPLHTVDNDIADVYREHKFNYVLSLIPNDITYNNLNIITNANHIRLEVIHITNANFDYTLGDIEKALILLKDKRVSTVLLVSLNEEFSDILPMINNNIEILKLIAIRLMDENFTDVSIIDNLNSIIDENSKFIHK